MHRLIVLADGSATALRLARPTTRRGAAPPARAWRRARPALLVLALVLAVLLVAAFRAVVHTAVVQGDARRAQSARQSNAEADCRRLPGRERRLRCRAGIV